MKVILSIILLGLGVTNICFGQLDPLYAQYMFNQLTFNPACAGSEEKIIAGLTIKKNRSVSGLTPEIKSFTIHAPFLARRIGIGLNFSEVKTGFLKNIEANFSYSYKILFSRGILSLGLLGGIIQRSVNNSEVVVKHQDDPDIITLNNFTEIIPDAGVGAYFQKENYYLGLAIRHIIPVVALFPDDPLGKHLHFYLNGGYKYAISSQIRCANSFLVKNSLITTWQADFTHHFIFLESFWLGGSYRTVNSVSLQSGIKFNGIFNRIKQDIKLGYAFDIYTTNMKPSHEIMLLLDLEIHKNPKKIRKQKVQFSPFFI